VGLVVRNPTYLVLVILLFAGCSTATAPTTTNGGAEPASTAVTTSAATTAAPTTTTSSSTTSSTTTSTTEAPATTLPDDPSQTESDAARDGVVPELANLPFELRVSPLVEVAAEEGTWMLARPTDRLIEQTWSSGCGLGNLEGTYPIDVICASEYGEVLLVDAEGAIARAYPMPGAVPTWLHVTDRFVYAGQIGDGGLPDSTLVRIDRNTMDATVVVIPAPFDGGTDWLPGWLVGSDAQVARYGEVVQTRRDSPGTEVASWIGSVRVDLDGIDQIFDAVASS
jgi:hypothetical protein